MNGVSAQLLVVGQCHAPELAFRRGGGLRKVPIPALVALIHHPKEGTVLFDTGYSTRFWTATRRFPFRVFRWLTPAAITKAGNLASQLRAMEVDPESVSRILLSHFDPDHVGGLRDFPNVQVVCARKAWEEVRGKTGFAALRAGLLPDLLPEGLESRLILLEEPMGPATPPFPATHDVFGDESVLMVPLPGHAAGQLGAIIRLHDGGVWFLAADAIWSRVDLNLGDTWPHRIMNRDPEGPGNTLGHLRTYAAQNPHVMIVPSHCPEAAAELAGFSSTRRNP